MSSTKTTSTSSSSSSSSSIAGKLELPTPETCSRSRSAMKTTQQQQQQHCFNSHDDVPVTRRRRGGATNNSQCHDQNILQFCDRLRQLSSPTSCSSSGGGGRKATEMDEGDSPLAEKEMQTRNTLFSPPFRPLDRSKYPISPLIVKKRSSKRKLIMDQIKITEYSTHPKTSSGRIPLSIKDNVGSLQIAECVKQELIDGIEAFNSPTSGRGLRAVRTFEKDEFVVEYIGELISSKEAKRREAIYNEDPDTYGSFMFYFKFKEQIICIDATKETKELGRLINHSKKNANLKVQLITIDAKPHLIFLAKSTIQENEELFFDYNETRKDVLATNPWLKN